MIGGLVLTAVIGLSPAVTLSEPAALLPEVLTQISDQTGIEVAATGDLLGEIVALRVRDRSLASSLEWLARAVGAKVIRDGKKYRLDPDFERRRRDETEGRRLIVERLRRRLDALRKATGAADPLDDEAAARLVRDIRATTEALAGTSDDVRWQRRLEAEYRRPTGRAVLQAMATLDLASLTDLTPGDQLVCSTQSGRYRRSLGKVGEQLRDRFADEWNRVAEAAGASTELDDPIGQSWWPMGAPLRDRPEELRLVVRSGGDEHWTLALQLRMPGIGLGPVGEVHLDAVPDPPRKASPSEWLVGNAVDPTAAAVRSARALMNPSTDATTATELAAWMSRDPLPEPWRLLTGPLLEVANRRELEFVAVLDDRAFDGVLEAHAKGSGPEYDAAIAARHEFEGKGSEWTIVPREPWAARRARLNRSHLAAFVASIRRQGYASVWDYVALVAASPRTAVAGIPAVFERVLGVSVRGTRPALALSRLLGSLPEPMRQSLLRGETAAVLVTDPLMGQALRAVVLEGLLCRPSVGPGGERVYRADPREGDPTAALERGPRLTLRLVLASSFDWLRRSPANRSADPFTQASAREDARSPNVPEDAARFYAATGHDAFLEVWAEDRCTYGPVVLVEADLRGPGVPYGKLPDGLRSAYENALDRARRGGESEIVRTFLPPLAPPANPAYNRVAKATRRPLG